ncbi:putative H(+)/Cl(-) exchange transporter [Gluconacetobacter diazotrophicus PA1 5]|uniref:Putative H(+)/Cl(-) exchange transporter n=1 Tax=Gluconacetobacter diazotrophicus (strain ATCC 49037 / DSM 5601 / CCUG 37298 / CIP 103539 / LMG 7603 / PAl5) TaxID=272568 RepID=A9HQE4_GLUDA|nr:putative H(+)/Cl(-) exchange transporter [Gluconacetobacter diazotrophicus PA1 5]
MIQTPENDPPCGLTVLSLLSILTGLVAGVICGSFRLLLEWSDGLRTAFALGPWHGFPAGLLLILASSLASFLAALMVRRLAPLASGSGIPHVEAVLAGSTTPASAGLIPVKFVGGLLAIGGGLALGREGPSVQMGATAANTIGRVLRLGRSDCRVLLAAGAGAGLATAFNAPGAGAIFVLEELVGRFEARTVCSALGASVSAILVARAMLGGNPDFMVSVAPAVIDVSTQLLFLLTGLAMGVLSVLYNRTVLTTLRFAEGLPVGVETRAALIGALAGVVVWLTPHLAGGGDWLTQSAINGTIAWSVISGLFVLRLALGALSYAAATPGGLFAPMLALGALAGLGCGDIAHVLEPRLAGDTAPFVIVGMAAMFAGSVRAPLTGIILVTEMTNATSLLLPLLSGSFAAMLVADGMQEAPIYEALRNRAAVAKR